MATQKPKKAAPIRMIRRMIPADALVWRPSTPLNDQLNRIVDERANDATEQALQVFEQERVNGLMGGWKGNITDFMYSLVGYLTTRKRPLIFSSKHGAASIAELMAEIVKANDLPATSDAEKWPKLKVTEDMEGYTNDPALCQNKVAEPPPSAEEALSKLLQVVRNMPVGDQDVAIASFLDQMKLERSRHLKHMKQVQDLCDADHQKAQDAYYGMERIARGDYYTLTVYPKGPREASNG
jgi:hypothetical protein